MSVRRLFLLSGNWSIPESFFTLGYQFTFGQMTVRHRFSSTDGLAKFSATSPSGGG
ncbi:MAG: hypothetical protein KDB65_10285 [Calditrichaeota bacterium]|nr:hypothetical protein [Calditrichota bacterium]MCB9368918.1 hypothetical protein [Calditrichota bacterium]